VRGQIERAAKTTAGIYKINQGDIGRFVVPIAPSDEQAEVVNEIDSRLSVVDQVEHSITATLKQAEALHQSILKKAFQGRLLSEAELAAVRADPAYEPADQLLTRIRTERAAEHGATPNGSPKRRRKRKSSEASA
jgi:type I restriction enzyme S subunit